MRNGNPLILIVDHSSKTRALITLFSERKYEVNWTTNGETALISALKTLPDLILLDVTIPDIDDCKTWRWFKKQPSLAAIPIIFLTTKTDITSNKKQLAWNSRDYINPLNFSRLLMQIKKSLVNIRQNTVR